ncbi:Angiotensin-converting enzyme-related protein [Orchesella cincta]|uniref:Angiotensin-converting enzyme-related protein n=1 Tax=Orchesella cincta TaxID=48709 RepID=A0A1D2MIL8_ORCCI|nr:Angiotensin-converting enzyme-related protein [Orchesella cincta]
MKWISMLVPNTMFQPHTPIPVVQGFVYNCKGVSCSTSAKCDFYQNQEAGAHSNNFRSWLFKNWHVLLEETISESKMDASAILEYFAPLHDYLREYRAKINYPIGWSKDAFEAMVRKG